MKLDDNAVATLDDRRAKEKPRPRRRAALMYQAIPARCRPDPRNKPRAFGATMTGRRPLCTDRVRDLRGRVVDDPSRKALSARQIVAVSTPDQRTMVAMVTSPFPERKRA